MTSGPSRLLLVGGGGGLVGRAVLPELAAAFRVRSIHRHAVEGETALAEWVPTDLLGEVRWQPLLRDVDVVLNLAWYRWAREEVFRRLAEALRALLEESTRAGVRRFLQVSVPSAPSALETGLPYLSYKRQFDRALATSGLPFRIVRPSLLFGPGDLLLGVMVRLMRRYRVFPMFGDGSYRLNPVAVGDLARILLREATGSDVGTVDVGGPETFRYRALTDLMFRVLGRRPRYWFMNVRNGVRLAAMMVALGSSLLYPYEVTWLASDRLALPPYTGLDRPMARVEPYLHSVARRGGRRGLPSN